MQKSSNPWYRHPVLRSGLMAIAALLLYGGWALFANWDHGGRFAWMAAGTQGAVSFTITLTVTGFMEWLSRRTERRWLKFALPFVSASGVAAVYTVGMHWWMGTPELVATIAVPLVIGSSYAAIYSANLVRESSR